MKKRGLFIQRTDGKNGSLKGRQNRNDLRAKRKTLIEQCHQKQGRPEF